MEQLVHGGDVYSARERLGREPLDFSANINPLGLPDGVRAALIRAATDCCRYPDPLCRALTAAIAAHEGVPASWVLCGNGAADLIFRLVLALRPQRGLVFVPAFAEYEQALLAHDAAVERRYLRAADGFRLPDDAPGAVPDGTGVAFLCNPNNPTGQLASPALLERILERCEAIGCTLAVDECFLDFVDRPEAFTMKPHLERHPRLILLRAFTKLYAMPGVRLGYALCADAELLGRMTSRAQPWSVSTAAQEAGIAALREREYVARSRELVRRERTYLKEGLARIGCEITGSSANYLFFRLPGETRLREKLERSGILIRSCANYPGLSGDYYRTAVRARADNVRLLDAMRACMEA